MSDTHAESLRAFATPSILDAMNRILTVTFSLSVLLGCSSTPAPANDAAVSGTDAGDTPDTGGGLTDTGGPGIDAATPCGSVVGSVMFPPLPTSCLPRCSADTLAAVAACGTETCQTEAEIFDSTPMALVATTAGAEGFDCQRCNVWQRLSCQEASCPSEVSAHQSCLMANPGDPTPCSTQTSALNDCLMANMTAYQSCFNSRSRECFP